MSNKMSIGSNRLKQLWRYKSNFQRTIFRNPSIYWLTKIF